MASKPTTQVTSGHLPCMSIHLKHTFENAVRDIYQAGITEKTSNYRRPIVQRSHVPESSANAQKRALSDAAKALAQLWKVGPNSSR
jgi:hypothetical protein